jgi:hypothetical protein
MVAEMAMSGTVRGVGEETLVAEREKVNASEGMSETWNPGSRVQPVRERASREIRRGRMTPHAVPRVTSAVCAAPPSRMNVTVTDAPGA